MEGGGLEAETVSGLSVLKGVLGGRPGVAIYALSLYLGCKLH